MTTDKKRILFVDDEPAILAAIRNLLYKERKRWDLVFANGGEAALEELGKSPVHVIVSDMRMPGMDGARLLNEVKQRSPSTARIMLSGHADREAIVRALPALHQLLSKPCDADALRGAIERGLELEDATGDARIRAVIAKLDRLPSPPDVYFQLTKAFETQSSSIEQVSSIVQRDPGLAAKVLQLVNSAYFGGGKAITSVQQAISMLGLDRLRYISMVSSVFAASDEPIEELTIREIQEQAFATASLAASFVPEQRAEAFAAALLHDVGQIVLVMGMTDAYREIVKQAKESKERIADVEARQLGLTHAEVGACLLGLWGLPQRIFDIVRYHHQPDRAPESVRLVTAAVHVADVLAHPGGEHAIDTAAIERAGAGALLKTWIARAEAA